MIVVLRAGDAVPQVAARRGEFFGWIQDQVGDAWRGEWSEVDVRTEAPLPRPDAAAGFIVTGSASSVTERAPWMLRIEAWLRDAVAAQRPVFGICFGHQLLGQAFGGSVVKNPRGREIGTVRLHIEEHAASDPIFESLPRAIQVNATHVDTVGVLPREAVVLARTELEPHAAFRIGSAWGVQFHPEIDGDAMRGYLEARRELIEAEGLPHSELLQSATDAPDAARIMKNFVRLLER